ncbi:hypothetical protein BH23ACI1_BH23ACI1_18040 [soil metagenome]
MRVGWAAVLAGVLLACGAWLGTAGSEPADWRGMALWGLTAWLYLSIWIAIAALVTVSGSASSANAVRLTGIWMLLVIVAPALVGLVASTRYPAPARIEMHEADRELRRELAPRGAELLEPRYAANPGQRPATSDRTDWAPGFYAAQIDREDAEYGGRHEHKRMAPATPRALLASRSRRVTPRHSTWRSVPASRSRNASMMMNSGSSDWRISAAVNSPKRWIDVRSCAGR